jgi:hypothetical protein
MATTSVTSTLVQRLIGAAALDSAIYEEVEADASATGQALAVVLASSLAAGLGAHAWGGTTFSNVAFFGTVSLIGWAAWAILNFEIVAHVLAQPQTRVDVGQLLRTTGFASAPGLLRVFGILPGVTLPVFVITAVWMLAAMVVSVRQALDFQSTARAIAVCILGWLLAGAFAIGVGLFFGPTVS